MSQINVRASIRVPKAQAGQVATRITTFLNAIDNFHKGRGGSGITITQSDDAASGDSEIRAFTRDDAT